MFFSISCNKDNRFPNHLTFDKLVINTDNGWKTSRTSKGQCLYKGYTDNSDLSDILETVVTELNLSANGLIKEPTFTGAYCVFLLNDKTRSLEVYTDKWRGFIMYYNKDEITNLNPLEDPIWVNHQITINQNLSLSKNYFDLIGKINSTVLDEDTVIDRVYDILYTKISKFISHCSSPLKVYMSGGVDTMLLYSFIEKITDNFEFVFEKHIELDYFYCKNYTLALSQYPAYIKCHHWRQPTTVVVGTPGDAYTLRDPPSANVYLMHHNLNILMLMNDPEWSDSMQIKHINRPDVLPELEHQSKDRFLLEVVKQNQEKVNRYMLNSLINACQYWHLGNTLMYTPLRDLNIIKLFLRLPLESALPQIFNSEISKKIIKKNNPDLLNYLSKYKNWCAFESIPEFMSKYGK